MHIYVSNVYVHYAYLYIKHMPGMWESVPNERSSAVYNLRQLCPSIPITHMSLFISGTYVRCQTILTDDDIQTARI